jgi:hypothetical protein
MRTWFPPLASASALRRHVDRATRQLRPGGPSTGRPMGRWPAVSLAVLLLVAAAACSDSTAITPGTPIAPSVLPAALRGEVNDPAGDSPADPRVTVSPDLVHATAAVAAGNVTFTVQFAPGTLDRQATRVVILLDTDRSASTGIRQTDGIGVDYALELLSSQASISKANPFDCAARQGCYDVFATSPITSIPDGMQVTVSLATLGNADGRMAFTLHTYMTITVGQTLTPIIFDSMPDEGLPPGRVQ